MKRNITITAFFLLSFFSLSAQSNLNFNGYYYHAEDESINPFRYFLRFYADGTVITVTTAGNPENLKKWFKKDYPNIAKGTYKMKDSLISFFIKSEGGEVQYEGKLTAENKLILKVKSLINKYEGKEEYLFYKVVGGLL